MQRRIVFTILIFSLASCSKQDAADTAQMQSENLSATTESTTSRVIKLQADFDFATVVLGGKLYKKHCQTCHGTNAQGTPDWRKRKPDGKLKPPPLNGTGHTWHHSKALLISIITNGTINQGGDMPAWKDKLSPQEMEAILTWVQSKWREETYTNWLEINKR